MEEALKLAIEGGWENRIANIFMDDVETSPAKLKGLYSFFREDPLFWEALGKSLGWEERYCTSGDGCDDKKKYHERDCVWEGDNAWKHHWHRFIDHLADGGTPDDFFKALLQD